MKHHDGRSTGMNNSFITWLFQPHTHTPKYLNIFFYSFSQMLILTSSIISCSSISSSLYIKSQP